MLLNETDFIPVAVTPPPDGKGIVGALIRGRADLIHLWPERAYSARTLTYRILNQSYFLCNASDVVQHVMRDRHDNYDRKLPVQRYWLEPLIGDGLFVSDGELWKQRRRACAPALKKDLMPAYAPIMVQTASEFVERWAAIPAGQPIDVLNEMALLTSRIIARSIFGDDVSDGEAAQVVRGFSSYQRVADRYDFAVIAGLPQLSILKSPWGARRVKRAALEVQTVVERLIERQTARPSRVRPTLLTLLQNVGHASSGDGGCPLSADAIRNEAIVMFMAGHETTANTLAWTWYLLSSCERVAARLHEEIDTVLGTRQATLSDVPKLVYTRAIFEEALRLYPPVPVMGRQAREADEIRGKPIAPGTVMLVVPWLLHRHTKCWDAPDAFRPERFLPGATRPDNFLYIPFSAGHRVCPGINFAINEAVLCIATLAQHFKPRVVPGHKVELSFNLTLRPRGGLPMLIEPRRG